ncbi:MULTISPECIES: TOBE domain-containing protein [unclassified Leeuwenhoekiella]|uniref:TOBE domain-containing protein n=1 Tax=unclassified Leeuwenhoekiella TaxID=2615029 RepID=UPI000C4D1CA3|nr:MULTISPECIES: TOBE domain-containing protein [unclassified Leeuwenhoekiella]MAW93617.1 tobe domain protein [Leeuwenhoekiella sp.]|tara:strand:- start:8340 stop:8744 length:405 start_codon:yes stop_codon:yes gene_type:complete
MNELRGNIKTVEVSGNLSLVTVQLQNGQLLKAIVIDTPQSAAYLEPETAVAVVFKETEVIISTGTQLQISLQNQIPAKISALEKGKLLSKLKLKSTAGNLSSIISSAAVEQLKLELGQEVTAMIKLNEVMLRAL